MTQAPRLITPIQKLVPRSHNQAIELNLCKCKISSCFDSWATDFIRIPARITHRGKTIQMWVWFGSFVAKDATVPEEVYEASRALA